jgi:hypothetical protein
VCAELCETLDIGSASVWLASDDGTELACLVRYERASADPGMRPPPLVLAELPTYVAALTSQRALAVDDLATTTVAAELAAAGDGRLGRGRSSTRRAAAAGR